MSGLPIRDYDHLLKRFDSFLTLVEVNNFKLQELINVFKPTIVLPEAGKVTIPETIKAYFPTGSKFDLSNDIPSSSGRLWIEDKLDSQLGIDGHKLLAFKTFDPNISLSSGYEFTVNVDPNFTTLDTANPHYIDCYFVDLFTISKIQMRMFARSAGGDLGSFPAFVMQWIKKGNFAAKLSSHPGTIKLRPNFLQTAFFLSVKVENVGWKVAVVKYESETRTITILGF